LEEEGGLNLYGFVYNSPLGFLDRLGLDVWIEGPNANEPYGHQSIAVGKPGCYKSFSFGVNGEGLMTGEVYVDTEHGGKIERYKKTTPEQDAGVLALLNLLVGDKRPYAIPDGSGKKADICQSFSQRHFNVAPGKEVPPPPQITPVRNPGVFGTSTNGSSKSRTGTSR
jgi:hypothetical protein